MSAAVWSLDDGQGDPSDPHERLPGVNIDLDDLAGRERGTPKPPRRRVLLRVWGVSQQDVQQAEASAMHSDKAHGWEIVQVEPSRGLPCPIPRRDPAAIASGIFYHRAWAVYPVGDGDE